MNINTTSFPGPVKRFAADTTGAIAIMSVVAISVLLGFAALALEYGAALVVKSNNQRTSDIAAYAAAFEYNKKLSANDQTNVAAATSAAEVVAALNGISSGLTVAFDKHTNAEYVDVTISEERPIYMARLLRPDDTVTVVTSSRVGLGEAPFIPCILSLGGSSHDTFTMNGNAGTYTMSGCGIAANAGLKANGGSFDTSCAAPSFNKSDACAEQKIQGDFTDPLSEITTWPSDPTDNSLCDFTGSLLDDLSTNVGGRDYQLRPGILCVNESSDKFDSVFSDPSGGGNTLIFQAGVDLRISGGHRSFSVSPSTTGSLAGVGFYAPFSDVTTSGNASFSIDGFSCFGVVVNSMTFNGNVSLNAECDEDDSLFSAYGNNRPRLIQ